MARKRTFKVVGVTFLHENHLGCKYPDDFRRLRDMHEERQREGLKGGGDDFDHYEVVLVRNPDNEHDSNAVEAHVPALGRKSFIGHVPANIAAKLAPLMDGGDEWTAVVDSVLILPEKPDQPGIQITVVVEDAPATESAPVDTNEESASE